MYTYAIEVDISCNVLDLWITTCYIEYMKEILHNDHCVRCKKTDVPLTRYAFNAKKNGDRAVWFMCRACCLLRRKAYRETKSGGKAIRKAAKRYYEKNKDKFREWASKRKLRTKTL